MKENIALLLAILYLIYRYKTYKKVNKTIEDRIENVHKLFFKRIQHALQCSEEEAEKVGLALDKYFVPLEVNSIKWMIILTPLLMQAALKDYSQ